MCCVWPSLLQFIANMEWVRAYGGKVSTQRTQYQTDTANFWLGGLTDGYVAGLVGTMQNISIQLVPNTWGTVESARFFAALNTGIYDSFVAAWNIKYRVPVWRPVTSIRHLTDDKAWEPLLTTPGHPEFPSGHQAVFGAFWGVIMKQLRNTTQLATPVVVTTEGEAALWKHAERVLWLPAAHVPAYAPRAQIKTAGLARNPA